MPPPVKISSQQQSKSEEIQRIWETRHRYLLRRFTLFYFSLSPFLSSVQQTAFSSHIRVCIEGHYASVLSFLISFYHKERLASRFSGNSAQVTDFAYLWNQVKNILVFGWHAKNKLAQLKPWIHSPLHAQLLFISK